MNESRFGFELLEKEFFVFGSNVQNVVTFGGTTDTVTLSLNAKNTSSDVTIGVEAVAV